MILFHNPPNTEPIDALYAYVSVDDTGEGIIAAILPDLGSTPLVTGRRAIAEGPYREIADRIAGATGKRLRLVRFDRAQVLWERQ